MIKKQRFIFKYLVAFVICFMVLLISEISNWNRNQDISRKQESRKCPSLKNWHDYEFIEKEKVRSGPGENGAPYKIENSIEFENNRQSYNKTGFSVLVSDAISVNRSIPDSRADGCKSLKYLSNLPSVSVIVIFNNEVKSVLLRTIHSIINRTPSELLHEIIMVNDNSTNEELYEPLQNYVKLNFPPKVKIKNLTERKGLIVTRLEGAREASGDVLVFFDSHIEVGTNWLPPLLEPIARNRRLATIPVIDYFDAETFGFTGGFQYGERAGFDWLLIYRNFQRYLPSGVDPLKPFPNPIMLGCAFAIDRKFFLEELGGYDEEFEVWNGENYELSFKLWLCAEGLYEVPCSRVTHTFRIFNPSRQRNYDFVGKNFKRLVEVWLDEYKEIFYSFDPERYKKIDAGDLSKPFAVKNRLNCKPFSYFLNTIAPDLAVKYPAGTDIPVFASGQIRSIYYPNTCIDTFNKYEFGSIGLYYCHSLNDIEEPPKTQNFRLTFFKNIMAGHSGYCLDSYQTSLPQCHYASYGNQYWRYDHERNFLINADSNMCMTGNFDNQGLSLEKCNETNNAQKWKFSYENKTALDKWASIYGYEKFVYGDSGLNQEMMLPLEFPGC